MFESEFDSVQCAEKKWIKQRREAVNQETDTPVVGLALSGGGIRSATFNLGVLQALSQNKLMSQVDLLSSVSGGGYIASCFNWINNHSNDRQLNDFTETPIERDTDKESDDTGSHVIDKNDSVLDWLRSHGSYLIAGKGFSFWQLIASIIAGSLLNLVVLIPVFLLVIAAASAEWIAVIEWPSFIHFSSEQAMNKHDGFLIFIILGQLSLLAYLVSIIGFALSGILPASNRLIESYFFRRSMGTLLSFGVSFTILGLLPFFAGLEHWVRANFEQENLATMSRHVTYILPSVSGLLLLFRARRKPKEKNETSVLPTLGLGLLLYGIFVLLYHLVNHTSLIEQPIFIIWLALSLLLALTTNVNMISMHSYYRSRLALAYMPIPKNKKSKNNVSPSAMDFQLNAMTPNNGGPLPIINTTINTSSSTKQKLMSREGDNFFLTPLYCGSTHTGFLPTSQFKNGKMALSTAFSISGAAVDPNTYATSSRPVAFLMALLNFRLGYWTDNPNPQYAPKSRRMASWYQLMFREMFGKGLSEKSSHVHLSDGGHFENLGLYELLRRRCRYIIVGDAGADIDNTYSDLGKLIQRARADFGLEIDIDIATNTKQESGINSFARLGRVTYSDGSKGEFLIIKSQLQTQVSADVYAYWRNNPTFPSESTADQFFDEWQFDSYRELGLQITKKIIANNLTIDSVFEQWQPSVESNESI